MDEYRISVESSDKSQAVKFYQRKINGLQFMFFMMGKKLELLILLIDFPRSTKLSLKSKAMKNFTTPRNKQ